MQLLAAGHDDANTDAEMEALQAVYAYEEAMGRKKGRSFTATRTWQMIKRRGIIESIERLVTRSDPAVGYRVLQEMGLEHLSFEAVVVRHPSAFSEKAAKGARERLTEFHKSGSVVE